MKKTNNYSQAVREYSRQMSIIIKSMIAGLLAGLISSAYRFLLLKAEFASFSAYHFIRNHLQLIPFLFILLAGLGLLTMLLVKRYPLISGSGIPQVKGIISGYITQNWLSTLIGKFAGGILAILAGLSLGREGPSIQLGASVAEGLAEKFSETKFEKKILIASGAGAGLAAAFNAPLAGALFALEEIYKYFSPIVCLSALASAVVADYVSKLVFGTAPVFQFGQFADIPLKSYWILLLLGILLGIFGFIYNKSILLSQKLYKKGQKLIGRYILLLPFLLAGILGLIFPFVCGGGHVLIDKINIKSGLLFLLFALVLKFLFSVISFGSGAPGGIFFPFLVMGALAGGITAKISIQYLGLPENVFYTLVTLSMCGFFSAIVRAPITGIILLAEMTGSVTTLLPLTVVSVISYMTADMLKSAPIYDSLLHSLIHNIGSEYMQMDVNSKVTFESIIHHGSPAADKKIKELGMPDNCLLIAVKRENQEFIPNGSTILKEGDLLVLLTDVREEATIRNSISDLTESSVLT